MPNSSARRRNRPQARAVATTAWPFWIAVLLAALTVLGADIAGRMHIGSSMTLVERWLPQVDAP